LLLEQCSVPLPTPFLLYSPIAFEFLIEERDVFCGALVEVFVADGLRLDFAEAVKVQLTRKRTELVVVEVLGDDLGGEFFRIFDDEHFPVRGPRTNFRITCFDHAIGLLEEYGNCAAVARARSMFLFFV